MIRINLLPIEKELKQARATQELLIYFSSILVSVMLFFILNASRGSTLSSITAEITELTNKVNSMIDIETLHKSIQDEKTKLTEKLNAVIIVTQTQTTVIKHMDEISSIIPAGVWINSLDFSGESCSIDCNSTSYYEVSQFYNNFKDSKLFSIGVFPSIAEGGAEGGKPFYKFKLSAKSKDIKMKTEQPQETIQNVNQQPAPPQVTEQKKG